MAAEDIGYKSCGKTETLAEVVFSGCEGFVSLSGLARPKHVVKKFNGELIA
jgi:hypothetical protein